MDETKEVREGYGVKSMLFFVILAGIVGFQLHECRCEICDGTPAIISLSESDSVKQLQQELFSYKMNIKECEDELVYMRGHYVNDWELSNCNQNIEIYKQAYEEKSNKLGICLLSCQDYTTSHWFRGGNKTAYVCNISGCPSSDQNLLGYSATLEFYSSGPRNQTFLDGLNNRTFETDCMEITCGFKDG